ncbi:MAG: hypothetical protein ACYDBV_06690, partial [Nitrospiria bacterium]
GLGQRPLTIHWSSVSGIFAWRSQNNSSLNINRSLFSVSCNSAVDCWAVGDPGSGGLGQHPLTIHWNGSVWTAQNNSALNINQTLWSVNCVSAIDCWAVGDPGSGGLGQRPLTIHWSSVSGIFAWRSQNNSSLNINRSLFSVSCNSTNDCWAVGDDSGNGQPVMLHWNGTTWVNFTALAPNLGGAVLTSVNMITTNDAWAVSDGGDMLHWDGAAWMVDTQGTTASNGNALWSIAMIGPNRPNIAWREVVQ